MSPLCDLTTISPWLNLNPGRDKTSSDLSGLNGRVYGIQVTETVSGPLAGEGIRKYGTAYQSKSTALHLLRIPILVALSMHLWIALFGCYRMAVQARAAECDGINHAAAKFSTSIFGN